MLGYDSQQPIGVQSMHKCLAMTLCKVTSQLLIEQFMSECLATVLHGADHKKLLCGDKNDEYNVL